MTKKEILTMSRNENRGRADERELQIYANASKFAMYVGCLISLAITVFALIIDNYLLTFSAFAVYFAMSGSKCLYSYSKIKNRLDGIMGMIKCVFFVINLTIVVVCGLQR